MADENKLIFTFEVDEKQVQKEFDKIQGTGKETASKLSATFAAVSKAEGLFKLVGVVTLLNQGFELLGKTVGFVFDVLRKGIDTVVEGEKIKLISKQFEILSTQAVGAGTGLREGLIKAAGGLVETDELLKAANKSLIEFNGNASDLPRLLEVARKISKVTGADIVQIFGDINQAIATQSTKLLRAQGLAIDAAEANKRYAEANELNVKLLTEFQQRQAFTNAVLSKGAEQLKDISLSTDNAISVFKQFDVQVKELGNSFSLLASAILKGPLRPGVESITGVLKEVNTVAVKNFGDAFSAAQANLERLEDKLQEVTKARENATNAITQGYFDINIKIFQEKVDEARRIIGIFDDDARKAAAKRGDIPANVKAILDQYIVDKETVERRNVEFQQALVTAQQSNLQLKIQLAQQIIDDDAREQALIPLRQQQQQIEEQNHLAKLSALRKQFEVDKALTQQQFNSLVEQESQRHQLQLETIEAQSNERKRKQALDYKAKIDSINKAIQTAVIATVSAGAQRLGAALVKGGDAFADFSKTVLDIIGNMAIQIGETLIGIGFGIEQLKAGFLTLTGGPAIAAGLALIALGGLLKSLSGGSAVSGTAAGVGGGIATTPSESGLFTPPEEIAPEKPGQVVTVNVLGHILDRRQTGLELADIIRESFEMQGTTIVGAV